MERRSRHFLQLAFLCVLGSCTIFAPRLFPTGQYALEQLFRSPAQNPPPLNCSTTPPNSICCDRSHVRTDICLLRGDIRAVPSLSSIFLYNSSLSPPQKIRPYTRKWEPDVMNTIAEVNLITLNSSDGATACDVVHGIPAVVFSTSGYTGNVYHDFNDGFIPLYLTSLRFNRQVVFLILDYRPWWISKYRDILPQLSDYPPIDFLGDNRTHCFPEITVGLRIHGELTIDPSLSIPPNLTLLDFRVFLENAFFYHIRYLEDMEPKPPQEHDFRDIPKMVIMFRNGSRAVENENEVVELCERSGFQVKVLRPDDRSELAEIYRDLNSSDAMMGVVGCALTHLLFMKPGDVFIQIVPLGTDWGADENFGRPAMAMGLKYIPYRINVSESSLSRFYDKDDPVLTDPDAVNDKGWEETKRIYLGNQTVRVDAERFGESLKIAYEYIVARKKEKAVDNYPSGLDSSSGR